jgi:hypothetical protein
MVVTNSPFGSHRLLRWRRRLLPGLVAGLSIGLLYIFAMSHSFTAKKRLDDATAVADRQNRHWRVGDLMAHREQVPDAENSALVLAKLDDLLTSNWPADSAQGAGGSTTGKTSASDAYARLGEQIANVRLDDNAARVLRAELKAHAEALAIARSLSAYRRGRHELVVAPNPMESSLHETQAARRVARLLAADAALRAEDQDPDGALDSCRAILGTARSIGDEPTLISSLVRISIDSTAIKSTQRVLGHGEPSDAALAQLQTLILDEKAQPLLLTAANGERAFLIELIRRLENGKVRHSTLISGTGERFVISVAGGFSNQQALALEWMNAAVAIAQRPTHEQRALWAEWEAAFSQTYQGMIKRFTEALPRLLTPAMSSGATAFLRSQTELGATAILIAAERQRRRTGQWPASIQEMDPSLLPEAPVDPFTGKPFKIEHRDGQLSIYSLGPNGRDEHGAYDSKRWLNTGPDDVGARAWDVTLRRRAPGSAADPAH